MCHILYLIDLPIQKLGPRVEMLKVQRTQPYQDNGADHHAKHGTRKLPNCDVVVSGTQ